MNNISGKSKKGIFIAIMVLSMYLNIENMITLLLSEIQKSFPNSSVVAVQRIYSIVMLVEFFTNFVVGKIAAKMSKRKIVIYFQGLTVLGGLIAFFFGSSLAMLYFSSVMIGFAAAIISTISKSIVAENYPKTEEAAKIFGTQQIVQAVGTIMLNLITGWLAVMGWKYGYLSFLFGLVSLFSGIYMLPEGPKEIPQQSNGSKPKIWTPMLIHDVLMTTLFIMLYITYNFNISYLVAEKNFGNVSVAGYLSAIWQAMLLLSAACLPWVVKKLKKNVCLVCIIAEALGFVVIAYSNNIWITVLAILICAFAQGTFSPSMYLNVSANADKSVMTSSMAMINAGAALGIYLTPYLVTAPSVFFGNDSSARFITAAIGMGMLFVAELAYVKKNKRKLF